MSLIIAPIDAHRGIDCCSAISEFKVCDQGSARSLCREIIPFASPAFRDATTRNFGCCGYRVHRHLTVVAISNVNVRQIHGNIESILSRTFYLKTFSSVKFQRKSSLLEPLDVCALLKRRR